MEEEKSVGCWNVSWNGLAIVVFIFSTIIALYAFFVSEETDMWLRVGSLFVSIFTALYTAYQVWRTQDSFPQYVVHELFALNKAVSSSAPWIVNRVGENIEEITRKQTEDITAVVNDGFNSLRQDKAIEQEKMSDVTEVDLQTLQKLWTYLKYNKVQPLLNGYANNRVTDDQLEDCEIYIKMRQHPKYKLYDEVLETLLAQFDMKLVKMLDIGSNLYMPSQNDDFVPVYYNAPPFSARFDREYEEFNQFVKEYVRPTMDAYMAIVTELKSRHIYHKFES